jgi:hypothetical protein
LTKGGKGCLVKGGKNYLVKGGARCLGELCLGELCLGVRVWAGRGVHSLARVSGITARPMRVRKITAQSFGLQKKLCQKK